MKKVIIRCFSNCSLTSQYHIIIFDKYNKKVYDKYTKYEKIELCLDEGVYRMFLSPINTCSSMLLISFIVVDEINSYNIYFKTGEDSLKITAILVDKNYHNLPIERGEIKLWQDRIQ